MRHLMFLSLLVIGGGCMSNPPVTPGDDSTPMSSGCTTDSDCDDGVSCSVVWCDVDGSCWHAPDPGKCAQGQTCVLGSHYGEGGCQSGSHPTNSPDAGTQPPKSCPASCNDGVFCTTDTCGADFQCHHVPDSSVCPLGQTCSAAGCATPPSPGHTINCSIAGPDMTVTITGPIQDALINGMVVNPGYIEYGSDSDGWSVPYSMGKPKATWTADNATYVLTVSSAMNGFNLFLSDNAFSGGRWFDSTKWTATGACHWTNTKIYH